MIRDHVCAIVLLIRLGTLVLMLSVTAGCVQEGGYGRPLSRETVEADERGYITLFDGTSTEGWAIYHGKGEPVQPDAFFVEGGVIGCTGYGYHWFRYEAREFADFVLRLEFKVAEGSNSGVGLRTAREGRPSRTGFEVQILDDHGHDPHRHRTGAVYDVVTPMFNMSRPRGEWNDMEITCRGSLVKVILNGRKVIDVDFEELTEPIGKFDRPYSEMRRSGYICLQDHWTPIWYRNIRIKPLGE